MTDVIAGVFSVICTALFLRFVWHPKTRFLLKSERAAMAARTAMRRTLRGNTIHRGADRYAWTPVGILSSAAPVGHAGVQDDAEQFASAGDRRHHAARSPLKGRCRCRWDMPALHNQVQRTPPVVRRTQA
jgi:lactate permease